MYKLKKKKMADFTHSAFRKPYYISNSHNEPISTILLRNLELQPKTSDGFLVQRENGVCWEEWRSQSFIERLANGFDADTFYFVISGDKNMSIMVIDGANRINAIQMFCNDKFKFKNTLNSDISKSLDGLLFSEFSEHLKSALSCFMLRIYEIQLHGLYNKESDFILLNTFTIANTEKFPQTIQDIERIEAKKNQVMEKILKK